MSKKIELATFAGVFLLGAHLLDIYLFFPASTQAGQSLGGIATSFELLLSLVLVCMLTTTTILRWIFRRSMYSSSQVICKFLGLVNLVIVVVIFCAITLGYCGPSRDTQIPKRFHSLMNFLSF